MRQQLIFLAFLLIFSLANNSFAAALLGETRALKMVDQKVEKGLPERGISPSCFQIYLEEKTRAYFEFAVREKHGGHCSGDPETSPVLDRYRVQRTTGKIQLFDVVEDQWK